MKPGYQSSEFWLACGVQVTALITALGTNDTPSKIAAATTALGAVLIYIWTRYSLKSDQPSSPPVSP